MGWSCTENIAEREITNSVKTEQWQFRPAEGKNQKLWKEEGRQVPEKWNEDLKSEWVTVRVHPGGMIAQIDEEKMKLWDDKWYSEDTVWSKKSKHIVNEGLKIQHYGIWREYLTNWPTN